MPRFDEEKQQKRLAEIRRREEEELVQQMAGRRGLTYIDLTGVSIQTDALKILEEARARKEEVAGFKLVGKKLHIAARSPERDNFKDLVAELEKAGYEVVPYIVSQKSLKKAWDRYEDISLATNSRGSFLDISPDSLDKITKEIKTNEDVKNMFEQVDEESTSHKISRLIEIVFGAAIALGVSDIHIEPQEEQVRLRYREDGVLHDILFFDHDTYRMMNSRMKLLSGLMLTQTQNAQDGRFTIDFKGKQIEIRTSVIPGGYGESIVMRLLNPDNINVGLEDLGIEPKLFEILKQEIEKPNGLILTTGPTGSGKTTTLYSFLKEVYNPEIKILTIEDPIEYHLDGITQTQVDHDKGYDFLSGLRAALRQDPDVVMVGEIRDSETAGIAVNASLTGHLVLSTLHTNNAAGAIPRLLDLGVKPGILSAALSVSIAQRLVRKLCPHCKVEAKPDEKQAHLMKRILKEAYRLGKDLAAYDVSPDQELKVWEAKGCEKCGNFGYKGRIGVFEAILSDESIQHILESQPSEREIKIAAAQQRIMTMKEDGVLKVLAGITSLEEVEKVVDLQEDLDLFDDVVVKNENASDVTSITSDESTSPRPEIDEQSFDGVAQNPSPVAESNTQTQSVATMPQSPMKAKEIQLLVDYLKMLEGEQMRNPELGIGKQMQTVQSTIMSLLKTSDLEELFSGAAQQKERVHNEVNLLMQDLKKLEHEQTVNPDVGVADKLQQIRTTIENLS